MLVIVGDYMQNNNIEEDILKLLAEKNYGLMIDEIASILKVNRSTASKYLAVMAAEGKILVREVGRVKLHYQKNEILEEFIR
ncbi:MAG: hypothetical protein DRN19_04760 [Thermoplasmata archaeon]|nr:MAG: hypothetical protein DRN19_04760 [Thermoplasmata archaeon]HDD57590.1 transcriptional regulator [Thermoplasmatales archaeon]